MKEIQLTRGMVALVDDFDFESLACFKWIAFRNGNVYYAQRHSAKTDGKRATIYMHRQVMAASSGTAVDHRDGNGLNNVRSNLRIATTSQNRHNSRRPCNNTSGFKGVSWDKTRGLWQAYIAVNGRIIHLGRFATPELAHAAYCEASTKFHGEFGRTG